ncbi:MAG: glycosyltransferase [Rhodocyclaceae bacterium]|nr:glycosyltransferase [Rhodocyclaceae bacterium]
MSVAAEASDSPGAGESPEAPGCVPPESAGGGVPGAAREVVLDFDPFAEPDEDGLQSITEGFGDYAAWRRARGLELMDAQLHAERLARWRQRPRFLLFMVTAAAELPLLARSLDKLQRQLYQDWCLMVVSDQPSPSPLFGSDPALQWCQVGDLDDHDAVSEALNTVAARAGFDWVALLPAGASLDENALLSIGDHIDRRPGCVAFYTDDDEVDGEGRHSRPRLKPDFDIDHLRGHDYVTPALWLKAEAIVALGGLAPLGPASGFEFLLRLWETVGDGGIGHIAHPLLHLPAGTADARSRPALAQDSTLHDAAVIAHLERLGLPAAVEPGLVEGARRVVWNWPDAPRVTIVIPTRDKLEFLEPCVESIFERTLYRNFDLLLVNHDSRDLDTLAWFERITTARPGRVRRIDFGGEFNFAAINNLAAEHSDSEFLCLLNNDTEVIQGEWLSRLVELGQRPDVGAVGARLVYPESGEIQHAGFALGLEPGGVAASPGAESMGVRDAGALARMQVTRACSAVSAACMLVRRTDYLAVGGMDAEALPLSHADVDLCLRLRQAGRRVLWTPFATLVHHGGASLSPRQLTPLARGRLLEQWQAERDVMLRRWLPQIAADPFHNRNLSLVEPDLRLEAVFRPPWDTTFRDRRRVLGIPLSGGSGTYRVREPFDALADTGQVHVMYPIAAAAQMRLPTMVEVARLAPDSFLVHALLNDTCLELLEHNRRINPGILQVFGLDDLLTQIPQKSSVWRHFTMHFRDARPRLRAALRHCDRLIVSTDPLAELCREMIDDIVVVPNRLSKVWQGHASRRNTGAKPRVGWVGALQHQGDLELIEPVVEALAGEVDFVFMGMATARIRPHLASFHAPVSWAEYPAKVAALDLDIALAPLEPVPFNAAKSNLRLLEYGIFGWPVVASDVYPYRHDDAPVTRVPDDPEAWIAAIRVLAADPARRAAEGDALQAWVRRGYLLKDHLDDWARALLR